MHAHTHTDEVGSAAIATVSHSLRARFNGPALPLGGVFFAVTYVYAALRIFGNFITKYKFRQKKKKRKNRTLVGNKEARRISGKNA